MPVPSPRQRLRLIDSNNNARFRARRLCRVRSDCREPRDTRGRIRCSHRTRMRRNGLPLGLSAALAVWFATLGAVRAMLSLASLAAFLGDPMPRLPLRHQVADTLQAVAALCRTLLAAAFTFFAQVYRNRKGRLAHQLAPLVMPLPALVLRPIPLRRMPVVFSL